jgi:hypothetical protein
MIYKTLIAIFIVALLAGSVGYFGYTAWQAHTLLTKNSEEIVLSDAQIAQNRDKLIETLTGPAGVSLPDVLRGFWYRYIDENGTEQVAFLDTNTLAQNDITDWQITNIGDLISNSTVTMRDQLAPVSLADMPSEYQFHNTLYNSDKDGRFVEIQTLLEERLSSGKVTADDLFRLGYIYELQGRYSERDALNEKSCEMFVERCEKDIFVTITGKVVDTDGMPVQSATLSVLSVLSEEDILGVPGALTDEEGIYTLDIPVRQMEKVRVRASKRNYSDGIANTIVLTKSKKKYSMDEIVLASPLKIVTIDTEKKTITGEENTYTDGSFVIKTPQSTYHIPSSAIVYRDNTPYKGEVEAYLYEFTRDTVPESLLAVDTMDSVIGYAGDLMKSFGMPYIQFFSSTGEELHVLHSNPMKISYAIYHMEELYNNTDNIYRALTQQDMNDLVFASLGGNYPIDRKYLIENDLLQFPAFWVFDRTVGVWDNIGINVITADGLIESLFYTLNDSR